VFLAVFKWEARKGWKDLIRGFTAAFKPTDLAVLWILARPFMESGTVSTSLSNVRETMVVASGRSSPAVLWILPWPFMESGTVSTTSDDAMVAVVASGGGGGGGGCVWLFKPTDPAVLWILARPFNESGTVSKSLSNVREIMVVASGRSSTAVLWIPVLACHGELHGEHNIS
jgi:hypothetical protein